MGIFVTFAVLFSALVHAIWNAYAKKGGDHLITITGISIGAACTSLLIFPFTSLPAAPSWPYLATSILLHAFYMIVLSQAYRYSDFSSAYPIARGTAPLLVFGGSYFFLNETLSGNELLAVFGIIFGVLIFSTRRIGTVASDRKAIFYALLTAASIAAYTIVDGRGVRLSGSVSGYIAWMTLFEVFPLLFYTYYRRGPAIFRSIATQALPMFSAGAMSMGGYSIIIWAMTQAPIVLVSALRETSIIIAALIGSFYFKEPSGKRRIIAAIIVCISVVILRWPN